MLFFPFIVSFLVARFSTPPTIPANLDQCLGINKIFVDIGMSRRPSSCVYQVDKLIQPKKYSLCLESGGTALPSVGPVEEEVCQIRFR